MARRKRSSSENAVSLFPFLSILACVIGTLTLMITALALGQMDNPALASLDQLDIAQRHIAADTKAIEKLQQQLADAREGAGQSEQELAAKRAELEKLRMEQAELIAERTKRLAEPLPAPKQVDEESLQKQVDELKQQIATQAENKQKLEAQLRERTSPPEEAVVSVRPTGSGSNLKPTFVECATDSVVLYEGDKPRRVRRGQLANDEEFVELLKRIAKTDDQTVVFLVRDDAIATYDLAKRVATTHYAPNGKIPVIGQGRIDLSLFQQGR